MSTINWDPSHDWDRYCEAEEQRAFGMMYDKLVKAIKEVAEEGRNQECWPILSFDWKDADLEPEGCTGIKEITKIDEENFTIVIGGHKTFAVSPEWDDMQVETAQDILPTGYSCEWTGDEWVASVEMSVEVAWRYPDDESDIDDVDYEATAYNVIDAANQALEPFRQAMSAVDKIMDSI